VEKITSLKRLKEWRKSSWKREKATSRGAGKNISFTKMGAKRKTLGEGETDPEKGTTDLQANSLTQVRVEDRFEKKNGSVKRGKKESCKAGGT